MKLFLEKVNPNLSPFAEEKLKSDHGSGRSVNDIEPCDLIWHKHLFFSEGHPENTAAYGFVLEAYNASCQNKVQINTSRSFKLTDTIHVGGLLQERLGI